MEQLSIAKVLEAQFGLDLMHQPIPPAPSPPPPPGLTPGHWHFFALDGNFRGVGTLELSNPPGWGQKKTSNACPPSTLQ